MASSCTIRRTPAGPDADSSGPPFVLVGGVPGAGKTTLLAALGEELARVRVLDSETQRIRLRRLLPDRVPYRVYRPLVHALHLAATLLRLMLGPGLDGRPLIVHDPATRAWRRDLLGRLAHRRGWRPVLVWVDVGREVALAGQQERGRVLSSGSFARHWHRWTTQRPALLAAAEGGLPMHPWEEVYVEDRRTAPDRLRRAAGCLAVPPALPREVA